MQTQDIGGGAIRVTFGRGMGGKWVLPGAGVVARDEGNQNENNTEGELSFNLVPTLVSVRLGFGFGIDEVDRFGFGLNGRKAVIGIKIGISRLPFAEVVFVRGGSGGSANSRGARSGLYDCL